MDLAESETVSYDRQTITKKLFFLTDGELAQQSVRIGRCLMLYMVTSLSQRSKPLAELTTGRVSSQIGWRFAELQLTYMPLLCRLEISRS